MHVAKTKYMNIHNNKSDLAKLLVSSEEIAKVD